MLFRNRAAAAMGLIVGTALVLANAAPASAQIFSWRDANGTLVLSDRPEGENGRPVPASHGSLKSNSSSDDAPADRTRQYDDLIVEHARLNTLRPDLVRAVIQVESGFNPAAVSPKGAMGLMQLMPATAQDFGVGNPFNPRENVRAGTAYLRQLLNRYGNDEQLALAAYNAGPSAVDRHGETVPPYRETRQYVSKVNEIAGQTTETSAPHTRIYRTIEIIDGREIVKYTDQPR